MDLTRAQLVVTLHGAEGNKVRAATLQLHCEVSGRIQKVDAGGTDEHGQLLLHAPRHSRCWLIATSPGSARLARELTLGRRLLHLHLKLEPASSLEVTVVDDANQPLWGATVLVDRAGELPFVLRTNEAGVALFTELGRGAFRVRAEREGLAPAEQSGVTGQAKLVLGRLAEMEVSVADASSRPAGGAQVIVAGASLWPPRQVVVDAAGKAKILGLPEGAYTVRAQKGDELATTTDALLARGASLKVSLKLGPGLSLPLQVIDASSEAPVPEADVLLVEEGLSFFPLRGRTDSEGRIVLGPLGSARVAVSARADGFVATHAVAAEIPLQAPLRLRLLRAATLSGRVVDERGYAIIGASIEVLGNDSFGLPLAETPQAQSFERQHFAWSALGPRPLIAIGELGVTPGPVPPIPREPLGLAPTEPHSAWISGDDGSFRAYPVTPGRVLALARHPEFVAGTSAAVNLAPSGRASVTVTLERGGQLEGRVVDDRNMAVAGARVEAMALEGAVRRITWTAFDGSFAFEALPRAVSLSVARPETPFQPALRERVEVPAGRKHEVRLVLEPARGSVELRVLTTQGRPLGLAQITLVSLSGRTPFRRTVFTDEGGKAELDDAQGRSVEVRVSLPGQASLQRVEASLPPRLVLELRPALRLEGEVRAVRGRLPAAGAAVGVQVEGVSRRTTCDESGRFELTELPPGLATFEISLPEHATLRVTQRLEETAVQRLPVFVLEPAGSLRGRVLKPDGSPAVGARVATQALADYVPAGVPVEGTVTDSDGYFLLADVAEGLIELQAVSAGVGRSRPIPSEVRKGRLTELGNVVLSEPAPPLPVLAASLALGLAEPVPSEPPGARITAVPRGGEAQRSGIQVGDRLLKVGGTQVRDAREARQALEGPATEDLLLELSRGGQLLLKTAARERVAP